ALSLLCTLSLHDALPIYDGVLHGGSIRIGQGPGNGHRHRHLLGPLPDPGPGVPAGARADGHCRGNPSVGSSVKRTGSASGPSVVAGRIRTRTATVMPPQSTGAQKVREIKSTNPMMLAATRKIAVRIRWSS